MTLANRVFTFMPHFFMSLSSASLVINLKGFVSMHIILNLLPDLAPIDKSNVDAHQFEMLRSIAQGYHQSSGLQIGLWALVLAHSGMQIWQTHRTHPESPSEKGSPRAST